MSPKGSPVARTRQHGVAVSDLAGEQHAVAVVGQESVLQLVERLEIGRPGDAYRRLAAVAIAPGDVVFVAELHHARVVAVDPGPDLRVGTFEAHILLGDVPVQTVDREAHVQPHADVGVVAAEHAGIVVLPFLERHDGRVEDRVRGRKLVALDDRIGRIAPHDVPVACGTLLPRHVRESLSHDFEVVHCLISF